MKPEDYSQAMNNNRDKFIALGLKMPIYDEMALSIALRTHFRDGLNYEADFNAVVENKINQHWAWFVGGGFGFGSLKMGIDGMIIGESTVYFPENMGFQTAYVQLGVGYKVTKQLELRFGYEIKELSVDGEKLKDQIDISGDPLVILLSLNKIGYEATSHTLNISLRYTFNGL